MDDWFDDVKSASRLEKTFAATTVSNHLIMFHVYFLDKVARPEGMTLHQVREILDLRYGKPTFPMKDQLMRECKRIRKVSDWSEFFKYIRMPAPSQRTLLDWLHSAQKNSAKAGYHRDWQFERLLEQKQVEKAIKTEQKRERRRDMDKADYYDDKFGY